ncbi:dissimilatory sulfite reductase (desulfoviridin) alpha/beta subunit [Faecalicoccus acidiformans]|uniref:Dissimilatory sulfite reductase (Desulfoviridin) alpha/beta subunit n=1 Tax=Faecalicoccus acidiformans TaxID=915173 RepID=A0A7W8FX93_9FIRM|nr:hypothetical protein [Faecalicoccus acidiformans]MBB5185409.1 dissimilatory sulfite reductase (desulfoviridin) alpha/beta subunit [Faecalicoccus acidiformans]
MKEKRNLDIRNKLKETEIYLWEVADKLGISETHFVRKMRYELPEEEKEKILSIIDEIVRERR